MKAPILVTAATGNVGREVVLALIARGARVRAGDRKPERVQKLFGDRVEAVTLDYGDPSAFPAALDGARGLFLLRPPAISDVRTTLLPLVDLARALGVRPIVFLSVAGAEKNRLVPHHAVEAHLVSGPRDWTILRPGFFAQNLGDAYRRDIVEDRRLYVPAGRGRAAFVDVRDVAELAARALTDDAHPSTWAGAAFTLTGPVAVSFADAAALLSQVLERRIDYVPASIVGYARHLRRRGMPLAQIAVQTILHVGLRFGQAERVDPTLARLLGRPGHTLAEYVQDHRSLWQ